MKLAQLMEKRKRLDLPMFVRFLVVLLLGLLIIVAQFTKVSTEAAIAVALATFTFLVGQNNKFDEWEQQLLTHAYKLTFQFVLLSLLLINVVTDLAIAPVFTNRVHANWVGLTLGLMFGFLGLFGSLLSKI
jgi:hypothetical protein